MSLLKMKLMPCLLCQKKYSRADIKVGQYFPSTDICTDCYKRGQRQSRKIWCFGKTTRIVKKAGRKLVLYAYSQDAVECKSECPDREICRLFVQNHNLVK